MIDTRPKILMDYVSDRTAALVFPPAAGKYGIGSSTALEIEGRVFLVTAGHVVDGYPARGFEVFPRGFHTRHVRVLRTGQSADSFTRHKERFPDVAWIELDRGDADASGLGRLSLQDLQLDQVHDNDRAFLIQGYPFDEFIDNGGGRVTVCSQGAYTYSLHECRLPSWADRTSALGFEWPPHDFHADDGYTVPTPPGLSGGGMWWLPRHDENPDWLPSQARLVAVTRTWWNPTKMVSATPIRIWLEELVRGNPDLEVAVRERLEQDRV